MNVDIFNCGSTPDITIAGNSLGKPEVENFDQI